MLRSVSVDAVAAVFAGAPAVDGARTTPTPMQFSTSGRIRVAERRHRQALVDTSVVIELGGLEPADLPVEIAVSAVTRAELAGPHATNDPDERARLQDRLQRTESTFECMAVDEAVARAYGRVYAAVVQAGRKARGRHAFDFEELGDLIEIVPVAAA